jgi:hypothetical protein
VTGALRRTGANVIASVTNGKCVVPRDGIVFEQNEQLMEAIKNPNIVLPKVHLIVSTIGFGNISMGALHQPTPYLAAKEVLDLVTAVNENQDPNSSVKVVCIMIPHVKDYFDMGPFVESMTNLGYQQNQEYIVQPGLFGNSISTKQAVLMFTHGEAMTDGQVCLPNATHVRAEPPNEVVSSVEQQMVMIHGEFSPNSINVNPEDEQPFKDVLLGLISSEQGPSIRVYDGTKPIPRYRATENVAVASGWNEHGDLDGIKLVNVTNYAKLYGLEDEGRNMLNGMYPELIENVLRRTPTKGLADATMTAIVCQIAADLSQNLSEFTAGAIKIEDNNLALENEDELLACLLEIVNKDCSEACAPIVVDEVAGLSDATDMAISVEEIMEAQVGDDLICEIRRLVDARSEVEKAREDEDGPGEKVALKSYQKLAKLSKKKIAGIASACYMDETGRFLQYGDANKQFPVPIITKKLGIKAITMSHGQMLTVHIGIQRCKDFIRLRYWWKGMAKDIEEHIRVCLHCQKAKYESRPGLGFTHLRFYARPGQCVAIDIVVLNHASEKGTKYFFTVLDCFSHYPDAIPMPDMEAVTCANALWQWIKHHGTPEEIRSDRGLNLNLSEVFKELYKILKIRSKVNAAFSPQSNQVERLHKWLGAALRLLFSEHDLEVDLAAELAMFIYRGTPNSVTGFTPFLLHTGREMRLPTDAIEGIRVEATQTEYNRHLNEIMPGLYRAAMACKMEAQERSAENYNMNHGIISDITTGDLVLKESHARNMSGVASKLLPKCDGPYKVVRVSTRGAQLEHVFTGQEKAASMRHLRRVRVSAEQAAQLLDKEHFHDAEILGQLPGKMVVIQANTIGFNVGMLESTLDDYVTWTIQWFNIVDVGVAGKSRLNLAYLPCWTDNVSGQETRAKVRPEGSDPMLYTARRSRIMFDPFDLTSQGKLPSNIKAALKAKFPPAKLSY